MVTYWPSSALNKLYTIATRCARFQANLPSILCNWLALIVYPSKHLNGPPSAGQRNAIWMAFRWWADGGQILCAGWDKCVVTLVVFVHYKKCNFIS